ncbi:hypothetical protein PMAYCL1PPCAC_23176, partial [Pristionchus mayeri]
VKPMSEPATPSSAARTQKLDFFFETEPLSSANLALIPSEESQSFDQTPVINRTGKRGKCILVMDNSMPSSSNLIVELDHGVNKEVQPIIRDPTKSTPNKGRRSVTWVDEKSDSPLYTRFSYPVGEDDGPVSRKRPIGGAEVTKCPRKKLDDDDEVMEVPVEIKTDVKAVKRAKRKRRTQNANDETPVIAELSDEDEDVPLIMNENDDDSLLMINENESDDEGLLMIDEGNEEVERVESTKPKRMNQEELRRKKEASIAESDRLMEELKHAKTEDDPDLEFALLSSLVYRDNKKKERKTRLKTKEELQKEIDAQLSAIPPMGTSGIYEEELNAIKKFNKDWSTSLMNMNGHDDDEDENEEKKEEDGPRRSKRHFEDMPELEDLFNDPTFANFNHNKRRLDDDEERVEVKKKTGGKKGVPKKKKEEGRPETEEEVLAEIRRKIEESEEKAKRMKKQRIEEKERKKEEMAKRKSDEKRERKEKKRKKEEARDRERLKKEEDERSLMDRKPKSRAEAARRTKALLALGGEGRNGSEDEEEEPKKKKRKYR